MTEYEALELINGVLGNMWAVCQFGFGLISAYCLLAYYIGEKLSFFEVAFVNFAFIVMNAVANISVINAMGRLRYIAVSLSDSAVATIPLAEFPVAGFTVFNALLLV